MSRQKPVLPKVGPASSLAKDDVAARFRWILDARGLTQADAAKTLNRAPSTVNEICKGRSYPSVEIMQGLAYHLRVNITWLLTGVGEDSLAPEEIWACGESPAPYEARTDKERIARTLRRLAKDLEDNWPGK